ncbi:MAG: hypothetical protein JW951_07315 [Lentisphaerae bacterium]|nr:hypothetical protein [Lentisphaerota bacterium]
MKTLVRTGLERARIRLIGFSEMLLILAWIGVWALWPAWRIPVARERGLPPPRVLFTQRPSDGNGTYRRPDLIARSPRVGQWLVPDDDVFPGALPETAHDRNLMLQRDPPLPPVLPAEALDAAPGGVFSPAKTYTPRFPDGGAPAPPGAEQPRLHVAYSPALAAASFALPEEARERLQGMRDAPWYVEASVTVNDAGRVDDVFIERGSESPAVNRAVTAALYSGPVTPGGQPCRGRVLVSFGGR